MSKTCDKNVKAIRCLSEPVEQQLDVAIIQSYKPSNEVSKTCAQNVKAIRCLSEPVEQQLDVAIIQIDKPSNEV